MSTHWTGNSGAQSPKAPLGPDGERLVGFDDAHPAANRKCREPQDHRHQLRTIRPYAYRDAVTLLCRCHLDRSSLYASENKPRAAVTSSTSSMWTRQNVRGKARDTIIVYNLTFQDQSRNARSAQIYARIIILER